jgi:hypothetical protein
LSGVVGNAGTGSSSYYYAVLDSTAGSAPSTSQSALGNSSIWTYSGIFAPNAPLTKGGINAPSTTTALNWAAPSGSTYSTAGDDYFVIVGWSAIEGNSWSTVSTELENGSLVAGGFFGVSPVAQDYAGGGAASLPTVNLWGTGATGQGLTSGFDLYAVPEPTTLALSALGGLSLLAFRRKKA